MSSIPYTHPAAQHPRHALMRAHLQSSIGLAVYLIVGGALAVAALIGVAYAPQLSEPWALLPYVAMVVMVLWFAAGAWLIQKQHDKLQCREQTYSAYVQRHAESYAPTNPEKANADAPWELHAFWGNTSTASMTPAATPRGTAASWRPIPAHAQTPRSVPSRTMSSKDLMSEQEFEMIASMVEHKALRPISLFGSYQ